VASGNGGVDSRGDERRPDDLAWIGIMKTLNRQVEHVFEPSGKKTHWGKRKLARDQ
jgi:hypothetical protein